MTVLDAPPRLAKSERGTPPARPARREPPVQPDRPDSLLYVVSPLIKSDEFTQKARSDEEFTIRTQSQCIWPHAGQGD